MRLATVAFVAVIMPACIDVGSIQSQHPPTGADASTMENDASGPVCDPGCTPSSGCTVAPPDPGTSLVSGLEVPCALVDPVDGRDGVWFTYGNGDSLVNPMPGSPFTSSCVGAQGSCHAACISGRIAGDNYPYAMLGLNFKKTPAPYDMSAYSGVSFYLYATIMQHSQVASQVRFAVRLAGDSDPGTGGTCMSGCNDPYQITYNSVPSAWTKFEVPFSQLMQVGFGTKFTWDSTTGIGMGWSVVAGPGQQMLTGDDYTLCVDQVEFVKN